MLCQFLLYNEVNQLCVYIYPLPLGPPSHPTPIPPIQVVTEHRTELPVLHSKFPLAIQFTHGSVFMLNLISQFFPPSPSPAVSTCPFPMSMSLFLPYTQVHLYHFSRFHIYVLIYDICFSLSGLLHSVWQTLGPSISLQMTQFRFFLLLSNIPLYIGTTSSLSIHLSLDIQVVSMSWLL